MEDPNTTPRLSALQQAVAAGDGAALVDFWAELARNHSPLIDPIPGDAEHSRVTFVWRAAGERAAPAVVSALRGRDTCEPMERVPGTDVWYKTYCVRNDTRESYQLVIDGENVTDPLNPRQHVFPDDDAVGFKGWVSSVLEMPQAPPQRWSQPRPGVPHGAVSFHQVHSQIMGRDYRTWVYTPPGYTAGAGPYGFLLVLDGWFYLNLIPMPTVLDNLLADGRLPPLVGVFVSTVFDPDRQRDLACHPPFRDFLVRELLPWARANYSLAADPAQNAVVGSSLGGLMAAYIGLHHSDLFGNVLAQSGFFGWRSETESEDGWLIRQYVDSPKLPLRFFMDVGRLETELATRAPGFNNLLAGARHMRDVLRAKGYEAHYHEFSGAHNPMNWPDTLPLGLMALLGQPAAQDAPNVRLIE